MVRLSIILTSLLMLSFSANAVQNKLQLQIEIPTTEKNVYLLKKIQKLQESVSPTSPLKPRWQPQKETYSLMQQLTTITSTQEFEHIVHQLMGKKGCTLFKKGDYKNIDELINGYANNQPLDKKKLLKLILTNPTLTLIKLGNSHSWPIIAGFFDNKAEERVFNNSYGLNL